MKRIVHCSIATVSGVLLAAGVAAAQVTPKTLGPGFFRPVMEPIVKNAPYSGEGITTVKLTMFDGNKVERTVTARFYRDSAGRVRREQTVVGLEALDPAKDVHAVVTIIDPVTDALFTLMPGTNEALRLSMSHLDKEAKATRPEAGPATRVESLGTKDIDGLTAIGTRQVTTIPAGRMGNDRPIEIIDERWESKDLQVLLRSLHRDPRTGDVEFVLTKVSRAEPAASLFQVPKGYVIRDFFKK